MTRALDDQEEHRKSALTEFSTREFARAIASRHAPTRTRSSPRLTDVARSSTSSVNRRCPHARSYRWIVMAKCPCGQLNRCVPELRGRIHVDLSAPIAHTRLKSWEGVFGWAGGARREDPVASMRGACPRRIAHHDGPTLGKGAHDTAHVPSGRDRPHGDRIERRCGSSARLVAQPAADPARSRPDRQPTRWLSPLDRRRSRNASGCGS